MSSLTATPAGSAPDAALVATWLTRIGINQAYRQLDDYFAHGYA